MIYEDFNENQTVFNENLTVVDEKCDSCSNC